MFVSSHNSAVARRLLRDSCLFLFTLAAACLLTSAQLRGENVPPHASVDRSGDLAVTNGMTLHLTADLGNVRIQTLPQGAAPVMHYSVHIETDVANPLGQKLLDSYSLTTRETVDSVFLSGALPNVHSLAVNRRHPIGNAQFWVQFTITVPGSFSLDVSTGAGDIETSDIGGHVLLVTQGGNITTGRISPPGQPISRDERLAAKIETDGGHITLKDVEGDVDAYTAGGHIMAGNIDGNAKLRSGGGHIRAARIKGTAQLETLGGNIAVGEAGSYVAVHTGGGQIDFGEAHGSVHAQTGGGGIRVMYVAGPMEVETSGGSICLTRVANTVHAQTGEGSITAWITPEASEKAQTVRLPGPSALASRTGDIVVFVPRNISMTIDATVETGGPGRIEADPSLPLSIQSRPEGSVHGVVSLNGGGAPLKLHTTAGRIRLQYLDTQTSLRQSLLDEQKQRLAEKFNDYGVTQVSLPAHPAASGNPPPSLSPGDAKEDWFDTARNRLQVIFMGSVHEDEKDFKRRLTSLPKPQYPLIARKAGIQGLVVLQVRMKPDGSLSVEKVLEGEPSLADAATAAVQNCRARPEQIAGKNVEVVSTLSFNFTLH
ncbi:MAG TPA: energy transducer TonB [Candidatus Sulfotelmatobacter sp.]|nr:energy transducer TonB [Candidatus Sulfotelmatobacter sp.]